MENEWEGEGDGQESTVLLIFALWRCFNHWWVRDCAVGQKVLFRPSWNSIFFQQRFKLTQWAWFILASCISWTFLCFIFWAIVVSDFLPLEIYKHLVLSLSSITFIANRQADNHFYRYVNLFQILYSKYEISFCIKIHVTYFIFKFDLNVKTSPFFFLTEAMVYRKNVL